MLIISMKGTALSRKHLIRSSFSPNGALRLLVAIELEDKTRYKNFVGCALGFRGEHEGTGAEVVTYGVKGKS